MKTCKFLASKGFHFQNIEVGVTEKRFTHVFIAKILEFSLPLLDFKHLAEYSYFMFPVSASSRVLNFQVLQVNYLRNPSTMSPRHNDTSRNNRRYLANPRG